MKKLTQEEFEEIYKQHWIWLTTDGKGGQKGDLSQYDLSDIDFVNHNLMGMIMPNTQQAD